LVADRAGDILERGPNEAAIVDGRGQMKPIAVVLTNGNDPAAVCPHTVIRHQAVGAFGGPQTVEKYLKKLTGIIGGLRPILKKYTTANGGVIWKQASVLGTNTDPSSRYYLYFAAVVGCNGTALPMVA
jgi:hypothetical protein